MNEFPNSQNNKLPADPSAMIMGIISILSAFCCSPLGLILGIIGRSKASSSLSMYEASSGSYSDKSRSNVMSGRLLSTIGLALCVLMLLVSAYQVWSAGGIEGIMEQYNELLEQNGIEIPE